MYILFLYFSYTVIFWPVSRFRMLKVLDNQCCNGLYLKEYLTLFVSRAMVVDHRWWLWIGLLSVANISSCPLFANYIQPLAHLHLSTALNYYISCPLFATYIQPLSYLHLSTISFAYQNLPGIRAVTAKEKALGICRLHLYSN